MNIYQHTSDQATHPESKGADTRSAAVFVSAVARIRQGVILWPWPKHIQVDGLQGATGAIRKVPGPIEIALLVVLERSRLRRWNVHDVILGGRVVADAEACSGE